jgi:hypothetical protein
MNKTNSHGNISKSEEKEILKKIKEELSKEDKQIVFKYNVLVAVMVAVISGMIVMNMFTP